MKLNLAILFLFLSVLIFLLLSQIKPFNLSSDMEMSQKYAKRLPVRTHDPVFTSLQRYTESSLNNLNLTSEQELLGIRCSDDFIRTNQSAYILKNTKTSQNYKKTLRNTKFIEFMRDKETKMPPGKKILTVKICETEKKDLLILYSIGKYESENVDNSTIIQTLYSSTENQALVQVLPKGTWLGSYEFEITASPGHTVCSDPFQLTKTNHLYLLCDEETFKQSDHYIFKVNLPAKTSVKINQCMNDYREELVTECS